MAEQLKISGRLSQSGTHTGEILLEQPGDREAIRIASYDVNREGEISLHYVSNIELPDEGAVRIQIKEKEEQLRAEQERNLQAMARRFSNI